MGDAIEAYNRPQADHDQEICRLLRDRIDAGLPDAESKIWHRHPVWFLDGNPARGPLPVP